MRDFEKMVDSAIRNASDLPGKPLPIDSYHITQEVMFSSDDERVLDIIREREGKKFLTERDVLEVCAEVWRDYPDDGLEVTQALLRSGATEHVSAVALDIHNGVSVVKIINPEGDKVDLTYDDLSSLLGHTECYIEVHPLRIIPAVSLSDEASLGRVAGNFNLEESMLDIEFFIDTQETITKRLTFSLDMTFIYGLLYVLGRLDKMEHRYSAFDSRS